MSSSSALPSNILSIRGSHAAIHTFIGGADSAFVNSHVIETDQRLIVVDCQYLRPQAKQFAQFVRSLEKPIEKVIITHAHPDHYFGLEQYGSAKAFASASTRKAIKEFGEATIEAQKEFLGNQIPDAPTLVDNIQKPGVEKYDGVKIRFEEFQGVEAESIMTIRIPVLNTMICADLLYNQTHLYLAHGHFDGWRNAVQKLTSYDGMNHFICGHGDHAERTIIPEMVNYLDQAEQIFQTAESPEAMKVALIEAFPDYQGQQLLDAGLPKLFESRRATR
ncbi:MBL fold metallo-hydrolase [Pontibacter sp. G13]|uniref:MBL fold metallo-hydrolase n=1 Tax=Pontibacter sp. G13 TaxID=3074898 RepID=UPI00288B932D|nr:MBL fold metallo-hydrolase [Pontibacter sp. G13]WNJ20298.1 MBL fold metallo-hydrolase [Pontibacter sp. G13]